MQVEHLADQAVHALCFEEYVVGAFAHLLWRESAVADEFTQALHADERAARLMADHRRESGDDPVQPLQGGKMFDCELVQDGRCSYAASSSPETMSKVT